MNSSNKNNSKKNCDNLSPDIIVPVYAPWKTYYPYNYIYPYYNNYPYNYTYPYYNNYLSYE